MTVQILTELDAVNLMLAAIGETPVSLIEDTGLADGVLARATLRNVSRQVQQKGWKWNTIKNREFTPTAPLPGKIILPNNTLSADVTTERSASLDWNVYDAGGFLYDIDKDTNRFTESVFLDVIVLKEFETLPSPARDHIAARAAREYQQGILGSAQLASFEGISESDTLRTLYKMETRNAKANVLRNNSLRRLHRNRRA